MDCQIDENRTVLGDSNKLCQLVAILLDNAMKYSNPGSPIRVRMQGLSKRELLPTVTSEGTPLPPEKCKSIFERFNRWIVPAGRKRLRAEAGDCAKHCG